MNPLSKPEKDEFEISLFGPGIGESILVHLGNDEWMLVDSCVDPEEKGPVALNYLKKIGIDPDVAIKIIVATHWHDDHINGLASAFETCSSAQFICSIALSSEEFLVATRRNDPTMKHSSGIDEFRKIIELIEVRQNRSSGSGPNFAFENTRLFYRNVPPIPTAEAWALSPSSGTQNLALCEYAQQIPEEKTQKKRLVALSPNQIAVALWIKFGTLSVLLGSDLENSPNPRTGWTAVLNSPGRPQGKASIFKIPHHGSSTAYDSDVWSNMVSKKPLAMLTPFTRSRLPKTSDVKQICNHTKDAYITSDRGFGKPRKRDKIVEKTIRETIKTLRPLVGKMGQVRIRWKNASRNSKFNIDLFGSATKLCD